MPINQHQHVKVSSWNLPKNNRGHPLFGNTIDRAEQVNYLESEAIPAGSQWNVPIDMLGYTTISIYGEVDANHPFFIFTNGKSDEKLYLLKEIFPEAVDSEYHFYINLQNTPRFLWIATGSQALTFTINYTKIE